MQGGIYLTYVVILLYLALGLCDKNILSVNTTIRNLVAGTSTNWEIKQIFVDLVLSAMAVTFL